MSWPVVPAGSRRLSRFRSPAVNPLAPVPSTAVRNGPPVRWVSTRVLAGGRRGVVAAAGRGVDQERRDVDRLRQLDRRPSAGPLRVSGLALSGFHADQAVPCDWSNALSTPQPNGSPVSSLTTEHGAAAERGPVAVRRDVVRRRGVPGDHDVAPRPPRHSRPDGKNASFG